MQRQLPSGQFLRWGGIGSKLCADSPSLAVAFFRASPGSLARLRPRHIDDWASAGRALYRGTWKSSTLACQFYEATPALLETLTFLEFQRFSQFLESLSLRSYDLARQCLSEATRLFPQLGADRDGFIAVNRVLAERSWRDVRGFFETSAANLPKLDPGYRGRFLNLTRKLVQTRDVNAGEFVACGVATLTGAPVEVQGRLLDLAEALFPASSAASAEFLRNAPRVLERVSFTQFELWHQEGLRVLQENTRSGIAFFRVESTRSQETIDALASGVELNRIKDILRTYCRALAGQDVEVSSTQHLVDKNIGWVEGDAPTTEGSTIYLPPVVDRFQSKDGNFGWFKVVATHQVGHIEFNSFGFDFERPATVFDDLRPRLRPVNAAGRDGRARLDEAASDGASPAGLETSWLTDMSRFFDLFSDRKLSHDLFTVIEDTRLDARVMYEYLGIVSSYRRIQDESLRERPRFEDLPMREAMVELIIRLSLHQRAGLKVPKGYRETAHEVARIVRRVMDPSVTVEDAAEATLRVYALLAEVPNDQIPEDEFEDIDIEEAEEEPPAADNDERYLEILAGQGDGSEAGDPGAEPESEAGGDEQYQSPEDVSYRGDFKPELAQLLSQLGMAQDALDGEAAGPVTAEQLAQMLEKSAEVEPGDGDADGEKFDIPEELLQNLLKEMAKREPTDQRFSDGPFVHVDEDGGPLEPVDERAWVYDEWDFRANEYKPRWCAIREKDMAEGEPGFFQETLNAHASLIRDIHRQFQLVVPEMYRRIKRLEDGEDHDLDAVIEAIVDWRAGNAPSEKLFWRRNKIERDVAVAFLLDMSASTAEAIDDTARPNDDWGAPDDPVEYMVWLRARRAEGLRRSYKRIVDIEKEGIVLLVNALEQLGDTYGIYGFSGYGRENVEFYVIKELAERFTEVVPRRIDRIAPLHATRMGPAIRHATHKLLGAEARSRILFMISDGRPQDRGYSREGVEKEYAVHDTRMALLEAKREGITPFCLTVDRQGHDYLKTMMQDMNYEVLHDIRALPRRLPQLYRRLTT